MTYIKRIKTSIDDRHCRGETTPRQNKLWQFIANIMIYIKNIYYTNTHVISVVSGRKDHNLDRCIMYDLCVIGAGCIGSAAARHASQWGRVCLIGPKEPEVSLL